MDAGEYLFDLLVEFGAVGDDEHARPGAVFAYPFGEPDHGERFAAALGVPDDAALAAPDEVLGGLDAEVLVLAADLLSSGVVDDEVVDQFQEAPLATNLHQVAVQRIGFVGMGSGVFHPLEVVLLAGLDGAVAQSLAVVAGHKPLHRAEKRLDELLLLVVEILADAFGHRHGGAFEFQHAQRDAVDVEHEVGALGAGLGVGALDGDFLGDGEAVGFGVFPVDEPDGDGVLAEFGPDLDAVAQHLVDGFVAVVEPLAGVARRLVEFVEGAVDEGFGDAARPQPAAQQVLLDVAVVAV